MVLISGWCIAVEILRYLFVPMVSVGTPDRDTLPLDSVAQSTA